MATRKSDPALYDVALIGAGVVGCALARRLVLDGARVIILEKARDVLDGASKGNSAILHTGFDAPPGSLEQACIAQGYREYIDLHQSLGLPILKAGALVLAWSDAQLQALPGLLSKADKNGVTAARMLTQSQIAEREPHLSDQVLGGFEVPGEYLIDPWSTAHAYLLQALANGATVQRDTEVLGGAFDGDGWSLTTQRGEISARHVITCAGLYGDVVDQRLIGQAQFTVTPRKGQFVVFDKSASALAKSILLPVPTSTTKGVVVCRTVFGNLLVGPTAEDQDSRTDAATDAAALGDLRADGIRMLPGLAHCEITATYAGLRPATEHQDYQIQHMADRNYVSVGGIRSTGLSAALGIATHVSGLIGLGTVPIANPVVPKADRLSDYHPRDWQEPGYGRIICHCERVTEREIDAALTGPLPPATLAGLKRRTRVAMGQCQGFHCTGPLTEVTAGHFDPPFGGEDDPD